MTSLWKLSPTTIVVMSLVVTVLSSMAIFSRPALSLETGYEYEVSENRTTADRYGDLKCTYLFAGLTHMRLLKLILEDEDFLPSNSVSMSHHYNSRAVICTLYGVADVEIGSLWLLHLYTRTVQYYHQHYIAGAANEAGRTAAVGKLADISDYVTDKMQTELTAFGCRPGNRFDTYEKWYLQTAAAMPSGKPNLLYHTQPETSNNLRELDELLAANNAPSTFGPRYDALKLSSLLLNNLGVSVPLRSTLMNMYDVQVIWHGTFKVLREAWHNVHKNMFYKKNGLSTIKKYYNRHFALFKVVVYRLTWKHLLSVKPLTSHRRVVYLKHWHDWLTDVQKVLRLQDDPDVAGLLVAIDRLAHNRQSIVDIIYQLQDKLYVINKYLRCKAAEPMILEPEQFPTSADQSTSVRAAILRKSLDNARDFLAYLKFAFQTVDFDLVRSLVAYVDDQTKW